MLLLYYVMADRMTEPAKLNLDKEHENKLHELWHGIWSDETKTNMLILDGVQHVLHEPDQGCHTVLTVKHEGGSVG